MQFSEWWQNLCWLRSEHFHREPIFAQILLPPLILLTLTYESQNADGKIFWHETDLTSVVRLDDRVSVLKTSSMRITNDTSKSQINWEKNTQKVDPSNSWLFSHQLSLSDLTIMFGSQVRTPLPDPRLDDWGPFWPSGTPFLPLLFIILCIYIA